MKPENLLTVDQVADVVQLSAEAVRRAVRRGDLRASKLGGRLRISPQSVDDWIRAAELRAPAPAPAAARRSAPPAAAARAPLSDLRVLMEQHANRRTG